ncbi:MAG: D-aminoacyl-tRNA deacylase [Bacteroidota bacterium]|nr:D-aminoacyl-tRNA deacylase [Bacteroidota bacterium]
MRLVIQRVSCAEVKIDGALHAQIGLGLLVLLGIEENDKEEDGEWLINKMTQMRIFTDKNELMNLSVEDIGGEILLVSQFTLFASTKKGNRPGFTRAASPDKAIKLYHYIEHRLKSQLNNRLKTGFFGAQMKISLTNDGPVTILVDSKNKE